MAVTENVIRLLGRYSEGLRLTAQFGSRSGIVHEYAYRNMPNGAGPLGRLIDRTFLQLGAWDGLRQRVYTTKEIVREILERRRALGWSTKILDIAAGTAPYLRELASEIGGDDLTIACHDRDPRQVMLGRQLAAAEQLAHVTFSVGDATDHASYLSSRDPDIILAIDLFPWFPSDAAVQTTIRLAFEHLSSAGAFLCSTVTKPVPTPITREEDNWRPNPAPRDPESVATMLRQVGFIDVTERFSQRNGVALLAWKPI
ncbi:MAG TPA: class I SAM-dependent methyltransferase family protein [Candidatus Acidoferrales bacterium]|nr:class I SAM-dependent methyltransferase family protein [Candidatus Acidoferrales bacterium]